ncbi:hypothetical protein L6452_37650 [Arctium lappa]|uniref:Uncharacterized protein n=1 Tax=Arctium lappa TaxID=4217 RepID=A0ACB8Y3J7_ARCLA|nr:hypothetical protein L6452_37650 [Arctium lappa]
MSFATSALAEAYVIRKHHQEKMKKTTLNAHGTTKQSILDNGDHTSTTIGCFPNFFKKIHPHGTSSTVPATIRSLLNRLLLSNADHH